MIESLRLALALDPRALRADLDRIPTDAWVPSFDPGGHDGEWSGVAFRAPAGGRHPAQTLFAPPATMEWEDTPLLARCPYFEHALRSLRCPLQSVRLLRLAPGASTRERTEIALGLEDGEIRLHVPLVTNPGVEVFLNRVRVVLREGEVWYLNVTLPHHCTNRGATPHVHLVADCVVNDWLRDRFHESIESLGGVGMKRTRRGRESSSA